MKEIFKMLEKPTDEAINITESQSLDLINALNNAEPNLKAMLMLAGLIGINEILRRLKEAHMDNDRHIR